MGFTLEILLSGMVAVAPSNGNSQLNVLVPDATRPYYASDGKEIPRHMPLLVYCCDNVVNGCTQDKDQRSAAMAAFGETLHGSLVNLGSVHVGSCTQGYGVQLLDGVDLGVAGVTGPSLSLAEFQKGLAPVVDHTSLGTGGSIVKAKVDAALLSGTLATPHKGLLAARLLALGFGMTKIMDMVHNGSEYAFLPIRETGFDPVVFGTLADLAAIDLTTASSSVTISLSSFRDTSRYPQSIVLTATGTNTVQVLIMNMEVCDRWYYGQNAWICEDNYAGDPTRYNRGNHHFELFYELAGTRSPTRQRAVPIVTVAKADAKAERAGKSEKQPLMMDRPICPPAQLEAP